MERILTATDLPKAHHGRPKGNQAGQCEHFWAANVRSDGKNGNLYYHNATIYSYGRHFPIARHVIVRKTKQKLILFTSRDYSRSTSRHKWTVRRAINKDATIFFVENVEANTQKQHQWNLDAILGKITEMVLKSAKARSRRAEYLLGSTSLIVQGNAYAAAVGLKTRLASPTGSDLDTWIRETQERAAIATKRSEATLRAKERKAIAKWELELKEWQAGGLRAPGSFPYHNPPYSDRRNLAFVRVNRKKFLQTTRGMSVPLRLVMPVLKAIRHGHAPQSSVHSGPFKIQQWEGTIERAAEIFQIGCHSIQFSEIERAAKAAGL